MNDVACDRCGERPRFHDEVYESTSYKNSFGRVKDYFSADVVRCRTCQRPWLQGYYEDFTDRPVEAEWGVRAWIWRPLTEDQVAEIVTAEGTGALDIDSFAAT